MSDVRTHDDHDDMIHVFQIRDAIGRIFEYTSGMDKQAFMHDQKTIDAVLLNLGVIGEAVKQLSPTFREQHENQPWNDIAGMRDKIFHGYAVIDINTTWKTIQEDIPSLGTFIRSLLSRG